MPMKRPIPNHMYYSCIKRIFTLLLVMSSFIVVAGNADAAGAGNNDKGILESLSSLGERLGLTEPDNTFGDKFLEPDQAFIFSAEVKNANTVIAHWDIADGYYMYRDKFKFTLIKDNGATLGEFQAPRGKLKTDETFGDTEVYYHQVSLTLPLQRADTALTPITLEAKFQGCADAGFCYPPITKSVDMLLPVATASAAPPGEASGSAVIPEQDRIAQLLSSDKIFWALLSFFGFGLLLAFTPCVFPMIPILSSIIVGQGTRVTTNRAFLLSLTYVMAMAVTYTIAGVIAGLFGNNLQIAFQNPWILASFSVLFVLLALSMFGFYDLQLPNSLQSRLAQISSQQKGSTFIGAGIMGFLSALIVGPCLAAPLAGALIYIGLSGDALLGGASLFMLSLGMGVPLLIIGTSAGKLLPRAGEWMNIIKAVFGVLLLGLAIWIIERIIPEQVTMLLWAALLIGSAVYMGAAEKLGVDATGWQKLWKSSGLIMLIYGVLLMIGAAGGGNDIMQPLRNANLPFNTTTTSTDLAKGLEFKTVKGLSALNEEITSAAAANRPVMLDFYADWCYDCKRMEKRTFTDASVQQALKNVVLLQADVTANDTQDKELLRYFRLPGPPAILFFSPQGDEISQYRLIGFLDPERFREHIEGAFTLSL